MIEIPDEPAGDEWLFQYIQAAVLNPGGSPSPPWEPVHRVLLPSQPEPCFLIQCN